MLLSCNKFRRLIFPVNITFGTSVIPVHFLCEALAYTLGYRYYVYLRKRGGDLITDSNRIIIFTGAAAGGFLGSHIVGVLERPDLLPHVNLIYFMGSTTIVGGLLGGLTGVELVKKLIGVTASSGDLMVYPLILAMIIGRIGCFFAGLEDGTYGVPSSLPWAIDFGDHVYRHPTNLYEILFWMILWLALVQTEKIRVFANGSKFRLFMVSYLMFRLFIEFIKPVYFFNFGLSVIQLACIIGLLYYYKVFCYPLHVVKRHA